MEPVAQIVITLLPNGQLTVAGKLPDKMQSLGMLEIAKAILIAPQAMQAEKSERPNLVLPMGPLPNGR